MLLQYPAIEIIALMNLHGCPAQLTILSGEEWLPLQHFCKDTSHTPDIDYEVNKEAKYV